MTDEAKGDGMTLEQVRDELRAESRELLGVAWYDKLADAIDTRLAAQSEMRVDEAMARKLGDEYFRLCKLHGEMPMAHGFWIKHLLAALQAAIGGKD